MSWASTPGSRKSMLGNKRRDTKPELAVRRRLHASGLRYRVDHRVDTSTRSRADLAFTRLLIAIFIDGCFWHGCPKHATIPKTNAGYWVPKLERNIERDRQTGIRLQQLGWTVLRFLEHENAEGVAGAIIAVVRGRSGLDR